MNNADLFNALEQVRFKKNMTIAEFVKDINVSHLTLNILKTNKRVIRLDTMYRVIKYLEGNGIVIDKIHWNGIDICCK